MRALERVARRHAARERARGRRTHRDDGSGARGRGRVVARSSARETRRGRRSGWTRGGWTGREGADGTGTWAGEGRGEESASSASTSEIGHGKEDAFALLGTPGRCVVTFRVRKRTRLGQRVVVVGSTPELGSWDVFGSGIRCSPEGDDWWSATVCVDVPVSRVIGEDVFVAEYNYAVIDELEATGPTHAWRLRTSELTLPSYAFMVDVMDVWTERPEEVSALMGSARLNEPAIKQVTQYYTGGASKSLAARDERNVKMEIWFPSDDCAILVEDGEVVEVLESANEAHDDKGARVGDVYLATVVGKVPNMRSVLVGVEMKGDRFTKTALLRDGLSAPAAWWKGVESDRVGIDASYFEAQYEEEEEEDANLGPNYKLSNQSSQNASEQLVRAGKYAFGLYDIGDSVIVEITRDSRENKGAIASAEPSLTGRFTVFEGTAMGTSARASKKLSVVSRDFLAQWGAKALEKVWGNRAQKLNERFPDMRGGGAHLIMRSASVGASSEVLTREVRHLASTWTSVLVRAAKSVEKARERRYPLRPRLLWRDNITFKDAILRELCSLNISSVVLPNDAAPETVKELAHSVSILRADTADLNTDIRTEDPDKMRQLVQRAIRFEERVPLPGTQSAQLVIQGTEALTAIDVNTGSCKKSIAEINVIAARTAALEIRRRNISGIIVIDFVNVHPRQRDQVYRQIEAEFAHAAVRDRGKISFTPISPFGLLQITRSHIPHGSKGEQSARKTPAATRWLGARRKTR